MQITDAAAVVISSQELECNVEAKCTVKGCYLFYFLHSFLDTRRHAEGFFYDDISKLQYLYNVVYGTDVKARICQA